MSALLLLLALGASPAAATPPRHPTGAERLGLSSDAQLALNRYGRCMAHDAGQTATRVLRQDFTTRAYHTGLGALLDNNRQCVPRGQTARFSGGGVLGAGAIAEGLLEKDSGALLATLAARAATAPDQGFSPTDTAAICVVKRDVAGFRALLGTEPASAQEKDAVSAMAPVLSQCLPAGQDFRFNRPGLRAILALSAFRIAAGVTPAKQG
ncbi:hypothetical protein Q5H91_02640 [Sphingomonas sp. KR1UV-12]|uniref:Uncharacterized protein n=1 Tax=Sphingomonas aurea TaxID=3063994 RepID=A0ABT9EGJ7_9SPHN|nr:hypothetical protein [Sphingomonas sp. KR1UV-12]MDP1026096.1 hypothetical protein [Sphingomonas sp. KR1UV-12]